MSTKFGRREYLLAKAEFERGCVEFSARMASMLEPISPGDHEFLSPFGPRKPAKRALRLSAIANVARKRSNTG